MILVPVAGSAVFVTLVPLQTVSQLLEVCCGKIPDIMDLRQLCLMFIS